MVVFWCFGSGRRVPEARLSVSSILPYSLDAIGTTTKATMGRNAELDCDKTSTARRDRKEMMRKKSGNHVSK